MRRPGRRPLIAAGLICAALGAGGLALTAPRMAGPDALDPAAMTRTGADGRPAPAPDFAPDAARGALLFAAGGCTSCHETPREGPAEGPPQLGGGLRFATEFGTFVAPNISPDPVGGIGAWSDLDFLNALTRGASPAGEHLYPAFPWTAYARMTAGDAMDMLAHIRALPQVAAPAPPHEVPFPFKIRRGLGLWALLFADTSPVLADEGLSDAARRGRFLVEGPGHCGECHTPRNALGALDRSRWLQGAPNPDGPGRAPDITPRGLKWSAEEVASYLKDGFTPEYDVVGGAMVHVVENLAQLPDADRTAIAAYLQALPTPE